VIYLVRHGRAEDTHPLGDEARALTADGRREFRELAAELGGKLGLVGIATSPLVRATQTAEILAAAAHVDRVESRGELAAGEGAAALVRLARRLGDGWALVGHNPSMAEALAEILGLPEAPSFRKGAIAALQAAAGGKWQLDWVVSPGRKKERTL
jgi:phosphohistidine phosphatase